MKETYEYTPEEAARIAASFPGITPGQMKVWKARGAIPSRYYTGAALEPPMDRESEKVKRLVAVLGNPAVAPTKFRTVPRYWWQNFKGGEMTITETMYTDLLREIVELRNLIRKAQAMQDAVKIWETLRPEKRLHVFSIAGSAALYDRMRGRIHADADTVGEIHGRLAAVYAAINPK